MESPSTLTQQRRYSIESFTVQETRAMGRAPVLCLLITLLTYFLIPSSAIPVSRLQRMPLQEAGEIPSVKSSTPEPERSGSEDEVAAINARMAVEMQDYQPSGPNGKHKPPGWR